MCMLVYLVCILTANCQIHYYTMSGNGKTEDVLSINIVAKYTDEQYATNNQSTAGHFDPRVFVNCLQGLVSS